MSEASDLYSEHPVFTIRELTRPGDDRLVQVQVDTGGFETTIVVTDVERSPGSIQYRGYEGNAITCPEETSGDEALVSIDRTLCNKKIRGIGRRPVGSLILIPRGLLPDEM